LEEIKYFSCKLYYNILTFTPEFYKNIWTNQLKVGYNKNKTSASTLVLSKHLQPLRLGSHCLIDCSTNAAYLAVGGFFVVCCNVNSNNHICVALSHTHILLKVA